MTATTKLSQKSDVWPPLPYEKWKDTLDTLHPWMQIVGKVKLKLSPFLNQFWEVGFHVTSQGMTTGRIPHKSLAFEVAFNFINHTLTISTSNGEEKTISLKSHSVADFYLEFIQALNLLGINVAITPTPSEMVHPIPFKEDTKHRSYDKEYIVKWWKVQLQSSFIFDRFRSPFRGKSSPVLFYWGSFDLSTARFSGKKLPVKNTWPKGYSFMRYAESEENFACGFWPGDEKFSEPAFYSYLYPAPKGCETINTGPAISYYNTELSECILPYEAVRKTNNPEKEIMNFLQTTYLEYATLAGWNINALEGIVPSL